MKKVIRKVVRVDQSPMNKMRWCLELECTHEVWVTAQKKPRCKTAVCDTCTGEQREG